MTIAPIRIGVLSDTHLETPEEWFIEGCRKAFTDCSVIFHAGDLTSSSILSVFQGKEIFGVHGNCCDRWTKMALPSRQEVTLDRFRFCITHGTGPRFNIEDRVFETFPWADCIVFGHSHQPLCNQIGSTLLLNPGSFRGAGRWGSPGSYGIITLDQNGLQANIHTLDE